MATVDKIWRAGLANLNRTSRLAAARVIGRVVDRERRATAEAQAALARLRAIQSITDSALVGLTIDDLLRELLARFRHQVHCDLAVVSLVDEERRFVCPRAFDGDAPTDLLELRVPFGQGVSGLIAAEGRARIFEDLSQVDISVVQGMRPETVRPVFVSTMGAPLLVGDKVIGVVTASSREPRRFSGEDLELLLIVADRVAPAIERRRLLELANAAQKRLRMLSRRLMHRSEENRRQLAVELHDELGQILTAAKINVESVADGAGEEARPSLMQAVSYIDQAMGQVRSICLSLRPSVLDDLGLAAALRSHADRFTRNTPLQMFLTIDPVPAIGSELETTAFRIAQEALTNIARHASATTVWLSLQLDGSRVVLSVRDDGVGYDVAGARGRAHAGGSMGLLGMEERAALVGGEVTFISVEGVGSEVIFDAPFSADGQGAE